MQFDVQLNGKSQYVVGHGERGFVGVHIIARQTDEQDADVSANSFETTNPAETIVRNWPKLPLSVGDEIVVRCITGAALTPPERQKSSANDVRICLTDHKLAEDVAASINEIDRTLFALAELVKQRETGENYKKFTLAVGNVVAEIGTQVLGPLYNAFPDLRPEVLRDTTL